MSRFNSDDYDEMFPNAGELWFANLKRAVAGRHGQRDLRTLEAALLALPEKRLLEGRIADKNGGVCAVGAFALHRRTVEKGEERERVLAELVDVTPVLCGHCCHAEAEHADGPCGLCAALLERGQRSLERGVCAGFVEEGSYAEGGDLDTAEVGKRAGMTFTLAWRIGQLNDEDFGSCTPEERYEKVLAWVRERIKPETVAA